MKRLRIKHKLCKHLSSYTTFAVVMALLAILQPLLTAENSINSPATGAGKVPVPVQRGSNGQVGSRAQSFRGEGVRLRSYQLRLTNKAIARAMKDFEKSGREPMWGRSLTILEPSSNSTATIAGRAIERVSYPQSWSDGSYELTLITYSSSSSELGRYRLLTQPV